MTSQHLTYPLELPLATSQATEPPIRYRSFACDQRLVDRRTAPRSALRQDRGCRSVHHRFTIRDDAMGVPR